MGIITNAAHQATSLTKLYTGGMKDIAKQAGKDSAQAIKEGAQSLADTAQGAIATEVDRVSRAVVRGDQFVKGATLAAQAEGHYLQASAKGAIANGSNRIYRAVGRADQFVTGAALATKAEARYVGQQVKGAAEDAATFIRKDIAATKADFKGAAASAFDRFDRSITRADQFATGAALAGKTAINQGIQRVEIQSALAVHGFKQQGRKVGELLESAHLTVRGEIAQGKQSLGEGLIKLGQKLAD